ncbi:MAG: pre-peptidase C-terminal domain-containing protein, partial [Lyngbya sp.]|nr:pre-peptidase C-terminal domain-containing protein [Lyngbya sp.]
QVSLTVSETALVESEGNTTTLTFNVDGDIPSDGVLVYVNSNTRAALGEFDVFNAEISGGAVPFPNFVASGFYFKILSDGASITLPAFDETTNPEITEGVVEGVQAFSFEIVEGPGYTIDPEASGFDLTIADNPDSLIQVSYSIEPATLIESESTVGVHTFSLSSPPPEEGITISVSAPMLSEFDLDSIEVMGGEIVSVNEGLDGFEFKLTEQTATINLPVAEDGESEGLEEATFTVEAGDGYQVNPEAGTATFTLVDTPEQVPAPTEISEPNDTIELALETGLSADNPFVSFSSSIDYENANFYETENGRLYVDFSEDVDFYKVQLSAGDTLRLDVDAEQIGSDLDPVLRLFDADGNSLAQSDDDGAPDEAFVSEADSYLEYTAEADGTYYVGVSSFPNGEFGFDNNPYEPFDPASGTGRSSGEYDLNLSLNTEIVAEPTVIEPGTGEGPTVSLASTPGTYDGDDNLLASTLVQSLDDGASILTLGLTVDGAIPSGGLEVILDSRLNLGDYFEIGGQPFSPGGEVIGAVYNESGVASGIRFRLDEPTAIINLNVETFEEPTGSEPVPYTFTLEDSAGYTVGSSMTMGTIYDTLAEVPEAPTVPEVGVSISETELIESVGNQTTISFNLSVAPPEEGVLVYVDSTSGNFGDLGELDVLNAEFTGGAIPAPNFRSSGFYFRILEETASITLSAFDESSIPDIDPEVATEGIEEFTYSIQPGIGYAIDPDASEVSFTIADNPDSVPLPDDGDGDDGDGETPDAPPAEPNDTIDTAIDTGLNVATLNYSTTGEIGATRATRNLIDASEDVDMYSFDLVAGETIQVDVDSIEYFLEDDPEFADVPQRFDSELRLFDAEGNELLLVTGAPAPDEIFTANRDAYLEFTAEETGTYYVGVAQLGNRTYDPFEAGTGSGRVLPQSGINIGEYEIEFNLTTERQPIVGSDDGETLLGEELNDVIEALGASDLVAGGLGDDTVFGGDGDDVLRGDANSRSPGGSGGDDVISGGAGNDQIGGKAGNDLLSGDEGDDEIFGDAGDDTIMGVTGNDTLTGDDFSGGSGSDLFVFGNGDGTDLVTDFDVTEDMIGLVEGELMFEDIAIADSDMGAMISVIESGETLAILQGVGSDELTEELFMVTPDVTFG